MATDQEQTKGTAPQDAVKTKEKGEQHFVVVGKERVPIPTGEISIRSLKEGFKRNGRTFGVYPQNFKTDDLKWTPDEWRRALNDPTLIIGDPVTGGKRYGSPKRAAVTKQRMYAGGTPGERSGGGDKIKVPETGDEGDRE